jgi:hypothetical protein
LQAKKIYINKIKAQTTGKMHQNTQNNRVAQLVGRLDSQSVAITRQKKVMRVRIEIMGDLPNLWREALPISI